MRLAVRHETHYDYDTPLAYSAQRLHLWPLDFAAQKMVSLVDRGAGLRRGAHLSRRLRQPRAHGHLRATIDGPVSIVAEGIVEVSDTAGVVRGLTCAAPDAVFLRQTQANHGQRPSIRALAEKQFAGPQRAGRPACPDGRDPRPGRL